jgi:hypothetical protein
VTRIPAPFRLVAASAVFAVLALFVAACGGGGSSSTSSTNAGDRPRGGGFGLAAQSAEVRACLKKQGITLPNRPRGQGPPNGQPPPNGGQPPNGGPGSAQFTKLRAALQKCGVNLPDRPGGGAPPGQQPPAGTTTSSSS